MNVYTPEDMNKECICECCENTESSLLAVIRKDNTTVLAHLCVECKQLCNDLFEDVEFVQKFIFT